MWFCYSITNKIMIRWLEYSIETIKRSATREGGAAAANRSREEVQFELGEPLDESKTKLQCDGGSS